LRHLPSETGIGFVIVQHLSPTHESMLPEILGRSTEMEVIEVEDEPTVEPNHIYVIPPNRSMGIAGGVLSLLPRPEGGMQHRPVDQFFSALAEDRGHRAIGVVLSGTGSDGTRGVQAIKAQGGITFAQDATAQQDSMPRSAINSGCVDFVLAPRDIAEEIVRIAHHPFIGVAEGAPPEETRRWTSLERIFGVLRQATGVDFTHYKFNTLFRRITRRAVLLKMDGLAEYADHLQRTPVEVDALYQDILISVTSFLRNPESFEALKTKALPRITQDRARNDPIRTWVVGCSTGEEAYSVAMTIAEYLSDARLMFPVQIYATDLNGVAIDRARAGFYPKAISHDITPERLRRFFVELDGGYRISKALRDMCVFARHNALVDPPFSRMDLICCRNLLIYVEPQVQKKLMPVLHYALKPHGFLMLGGAETIGTYRDLFDSEDARSKLYSKRSGKAHLEMPALIARGNPIALAAGEKRPRPGRELPRDVQTDVQREADRVLMSRYAPAGVLVNADLEVLQFRGDTGVYLTPAPGRASLNLLKMAREGLIVSLRSALHRARKEGSMAREEGVRIKSNGGFREVDVVVIPVKGDMANERCYLVLFEDPAARRPASAEKRAEPQDAAPVDDKDRHLLRLTQELAPRANTAIGDRTAGRFRRGVAIGQRRDSVFKRRTPEHQRGAGDRQRRDPVQQRGTDHRQRGAAEPQRGAEPRQQRSHQSAAQRADADRDDVAGPAHPAFHAHGRGRDRPDSLGHGPPHRGHQVRPRRARPHRSGAGGDRHGGRAGAGSAGQDRSLALAAHPAVPHHGQQDRRCGDRAGRHPRPEAVAGGVHPPGPHPGAHARADHRARARRRDRLLESRRRATVRLRQAGSGGAQQP
jgi:two-component system CheB/CheR fusion protein